MFGRVPKRKRATTYTRSRVKAYRKKKFGPINMTIGTVRRRGGRIMRAGPARMGPPLTLQRYPNRHSYWHVPGRGRRFYSKRR